MAKIRKKRVTKRYITPKDCPFCKAGTTPDYKEYKKLGEYLTARSAIKPRKYSGICSSHQRELGQEIKRARNLALLPFLPQ